MRLHTLPLRTLTHQPMSPVSSEICPIPHYLYISHTLGHKTCISNCHFRRVRIPLFGITNLLRLHCTPRCFLILTKASIAKDSILCPLHSSLSLMSQISRYIFCPSELISCICQLIIPMIRPFRQRPRPSRFIFFLRMTFDSL